MVNIIVENRELTQAYNKFPIVITLAENSRLEIGLISNILRAHPKLKELVSPEFPEKRSSLIVYGDFMSHPIIVMTTKKKSSTNVTKEEFIQTLLALRNRLLEEGIKEVAIGRYGTDFNQFSKTYVAEAVRSVFKGINITVRICE